MKKCRNSFYFKFSNFNKILQSHIFLLKNEKQTIMLSFTFSRYFLQLFFTKQQNNKMDIYLNKARLKIMNIIYFFKFHNPYIIYYI